MLQEMFSFADLLVACAVAAIMGSVLTGAVVLSSVREIRTQRKAASHVHRQAAELLRLAERAGVTTDTWDPALLRRAPSTASQGSAGPGAEGIRTGARRSRHGRQQ